MKDKLLNKDEKKELDKLLKNKNPDYLKGFLEGTIFIIKNMKRHFEED